MNQEAQEYYNIASWTKDKVNYNRVSKFNTNKHRQVLHGQIWFCDKLGIYHGHSYIETVRGIGYRLNKEVLYEDE